MNCPSCRESLPEGFKFCGHCGASLTTNEAERRQLTVMFVDLVGSTSLSESLDTEVLRQLIREYQAACQEAVDRCQGYIAQYLGDGLLIYFGFPHAYGDDARRGLTCGLEILKLLPRLNERLQVNLQLRLGVHTGEVIVGEIGAKRESLALGETPNVAARLQSLAEPDTLVVSQTTYELTKDHFRFQELGSHSLKGLSKETRAYRVTQELDEHKRRQRQRARQAALPLIGRDEELSRLLHAWHKTRAGQGGTVLIQAEEGMGKRRLVQVLKDQVVAEKHSLLTAYCTPAIQSVPLRPIIDMLERDLGLARDDPASKKWQKLEESLPQGMAPELALPLLSRLLLDLDDAAPPPAQTRRLTFQCLHHFVAERARPLLLVVDGLDHADPSTREWLQGLKAPNLLTVCIGESSWEADEVIRLYHLGSRDSTKIVEHFTGDRRLPAEVVNYIVSRADGVPMFLEEVTRLVLDSDVLTDDLQLRGSLAHLGVPATLYDSFMARLDRLGPARELLQWGAVMGGELDSVLLQKLTGQSDVTALLDTDLLRRTPNGYAIRHPLTLEVAYRSLLKSTRADFHRRAAEAIQQHRPELAQARPDLMARHYHEGGQSQQAVPYWLKAGQRALALSANAEAATLLREALHHQPEPHVELDLLMALGPALIATRGYGALEVEQTYQRARQLCRNLGDTVQLFPVLCGLWVFYLVRGELDRAQEMADKLERLSENDPAYRLLADAARGQTAFYKGHFDTAETLLSQAVARHDPEMHKGLAFTYFDTDPVAGSLSYLAWTRLIKGDPAAAREADERARELAQSHAHTRAHALFFSAWLDLTDGQPEQAQAKAEELNAFALHESFPLWIAVARVLDSWTRIATDPNAADALVLALERVQATGARLGGTWFAAMPAQMLAAAGDRASALQLLSQALITCEEFGERWYEVELRRLRAQLLDDPEPALQQARELAQQQNAQLWLSRL